jgi:hypothetical protein
MPYFARNNKKKQAVYVPVVDLTDPFTKNSIMSTYTINFLNFVSDPPQKNIFPFRLKKYLSF